MLKVLAGSTLKIPAPEGAVSLSLAGEGVRAGPYPVVDGVVKLTPAITKGALKAGVLFVSEWSLSVDGDVYLRVGPRVRVKGSIANKDVTGLRLSVIDETIKNARAALRDMSDGAVTSFSGGDRNYSFETRGELVNFISKLVKARNRARGRKRADVRLI